MKWNVLDSSYLFNEPWLTVRRDKCELPNGNVMEAFYVNEYPDWVNVFGLTNEGKVLLVRQYRHGLGTIETEVPGGALEAGEQPQEGAAREVLEETGYRFQTMEYIGKVCANPSTTNNYTHFFLATGGEKVAEPELDHSEDIDVLLLDITEVKTLLRENRLMQSLHVSCILYALAKLGELHF